MVATGKAIHTTALATEDAPSSIRDFLAVDKAAQAKIHESKIKIPFSKTIKIDFKRVITDSISIIFTPRCPLRSVLTKKEAWEPSSITVLRLSTAHSSIIAQ